WISDQMKGGMTVESSRDDAWISLLSGIVDRVLPELDPEFAQLNALEFDPENAETSRALATQFGNSLNPRIHERIGDRLRHSSDAGLRRAALFHYTVAETLDAASGDEDSARDSAHKRASVARTLPGNEVIEAQKSLATWTSAASPIDALQTVPDEESA